MLRFRRVFDPSTSTMCNEWSRSDIPFSPEESKVAAFTATAEDFVSIMQLLKTYLQADPVTLKLVISSYKGV